MNPSIENETRPELNAFCYYIKNLNRHSSRDIVWKCLEKFGTIKQLQILKLEEPAAVVIYVFKPSERLFISSVIIDGSTVKVIPLPFSKYVKSFTGGLYANRLSFGGMSSPTLYIKEWSATQFITFDANLNEHYIEIYFAHIDGYYRFRIYFDESIQNMLVLQRHNDISFLTINSKYPPLFWRSKIPMENLPDWYYLHDWERITEIPLDNFSREIARQKIKNGPTKKLEPVTPNSSKDLIKLNLWTVYQLEFHLPLRSSPNNELSHEILDSRIRMLKSVFNNNIPPSKIPRIISQLPIKNVDIDSFLEKMQFDVRYLIEHALQLKILREYNLEADFFEKMKALPPNISCTFLSLLAAPQERIYNPDTSINQIYKLCKNQISLQLSPPKDHCLLRRVIITPTSIYPLQPTFERMNQVQYQFKDYADRFLYVEFTDEDLTPIKPTMDQYGNYNGIEEQNGKLYDRIFNILRCGIKIAGRTFEFLGSSINDLRSHSCWFFSPTDGLTREAILNWMGKFNEVASLAEFVNNTGLVLMPRLMNIELKRNEIEEIEDLIDEYNNVFSLECGKMSPHIAREIATKLNLEYTPSVVQFKLGGFKGILMVSNYLKGRKIQLRDSQFKFFMPNLNMTITKYSKNNKVYLDWRSITLLTSLGVGYHHIENLLQEEINTYDKPSSCYNKSNSYTFHHHYYLKNHLFDFEYLMNYASITVKEPFISNFINSLENQRIKELKEHSRIHVPNATKVFAIMDDTGVLEPGEVFLQINNFDATNLTSRQIIEGPVVVYRDGSCFPSDARVYKAVNYEKLRHYNNVLVYSTRDRCALPSLCSNDEPDEDNFTQVIYINVIWDSRLIPTKVNVGSRNFESVKPPNNLKKIAFIEAAKFVTTYISKDISSKLKEAYIANADFESQGTFNGNCIFLAEQIYHSTDFVKTGMYPSLTIQSSQHPYPSFMENDPLKSYTSNRPLGKVYQLVKPLPYKSLLGNYCGYDQRLYLEDMYKYIIEARKTKAIYDHSLRLLLAQYGIKSEIEFISGHIVHWPKYISSSQKNTYSDRVLAAFSAFRKHWQETFYKDLGFEDGRYNYDVRRKDPETMEKIEAKAAAWYYVTYHPSEFKSDVIYNSTLLRFLSFPWTMDEYLSIIAKRNNDRIPSEQYAQAIPAEKINSTIDKNLFIYDSDSDSDSEYDSNSNYDSDYVEKEEEEEDNSEEDNPIIILDVKLSNLLI